MQVKGISFSSNVEYLLTRPGIFKLLTLVFGIATIGIGVHGIQDSSYNDNVEEEIENESTFESIAVGSFVLSFLYLCLLCVSDDLANHNINRYVDTIYHAVIGKSLLVSGILLIVSAAHIEGLAVCKTYTYFERAGKCQLHDYKVLGGAFALFNGILYEFVAYFVYTAKDLT